jgi:hypothetical protein
MGARKTHFVPEMPNHPLMWGEPIHHWDRPLVITRDIANFDVVLTIIGGPDEPKH